MIDRPSSRETLLDLARRISNLRPDWQQPERFCEVRSELAAELRRLANQTERHQPPHKLSASIHY